MRVNRQIIKRPLSSSGIALELKLKISDLDEVFISNGWYKEDNGRWVRKDATVILGLKEAKQIYSAIGKMLEGLI